MNSSASVIIDTDILIDYLKAKEEATAINFKSDFITKNQRGYKFIPDLNLRPY